VAEDELIISGWVVAAVVGMLILAAELYILFFVVWSQSMPDVSPSFQVDLKSWQDYCDCEERLEAALGMQGAPKGAPCVYGHMINESRRGLRC
jgi:hypothetical protein